MTLPLKRVRAVLMSGKVTVDSGVGALISGQRLNLASGIYHASGQGVLISGQMVDVESGIHVVISGAGVAIASGVGVQVQSGVQTIEGVGTKISGNYVGIEAAATQLPNVAGFNFVIKNLAGQSEIFVAGAGVNSGAGLVLDAGNSLSDIGVDNLNRLYGWAVTSGEYLSWMAVTY